MRLGIVFSDGAGTARVGHLVPGTTAISFAGAIPATGGIRHYQVWHRNPAAYCQPEGFNLSNGLTLDWTY